MKKIITISLLAASLTATSSFGQGFLQMNSVRSQVWDGFTTAGTAAVASTVDVALYWAAGANVANPFPVASTLVTGNSGTASTASGVGYTDSQAWTDILGSSFTLAQDASAGNANWIVTTTSKGAVQYGSPAGASWSINGTTAGGTITLIELAWNAAFATPTIAAANGSAIGWSYLNSFALATSSTDPNVSQPTFTSYSTFIPAVVPEPTTIALAGLGGLSLLLARRKK